MQSTGSHPSTQGRHSPILVDMPSAGALGVGHQDVWKRTVVALQSSSTKSVKVVAVAEDVST